MTNLLLCGCEPHGHKCLISEGGCGRCFEHCVCTPSGVKENMISSPFLDYVVSNDRGLTAHRLRINTTQLIKAVRRAIDARLYMMPLEEFQVIVGLDVLKSCAINCPEIDLSNFYQRGIFIDGCTVQFIGWAEGVLIVPA